MDAANDRTCAVCKLLETHQARPVETFPFGRPSWSLLCLLAVAACGSTEPGKGGTVGAAVCAPVAPTECPDPAPRYPDVAPIFERRCTSCHGATEDGPWPLDTYEDVAAWASDIRDELLRCSMPPADSGVNMTAEERNQILAWVRCKHPL